VFHGHAKDFAYETNVLKFTSWLACESWTVDKDNLLQPC